jgi:toxin CptA
MGDLRIEVAPSTWLAVALGAMHVAAAVLLWVVPLAVPVKALLTFAVAASLVYLMARDALLHAPHSIVALQTRDDAVFLQTRDGEWLEGEVLGSSYVSPLLTVVNFRPRGRWRARHVILVPDNVNPDDFRRLRTWLRWKRGEADARASSEPG